MSTMYVRQEVERRRAGQDEFSALKVPPVVREALRSIKREVTDAAKEACDAKDATIRRLRRAKGHAEHCPRRKGDARCVCGLAAAERELRRLRRELRETRRELRTVEITLRPPLPKDEMTLRTLAQVAHRDAERALRTKPARRKR
jgi:hypothetical protein